MYVCRRDGATRGKEVSLTIYLAGPMEHVSKEDSTDWRQAVQHYFNDYRFIKFLDPTRRTHTGKQSEMKRIFDLDMMDIRNCDIVLANLDKPALAKHGTACEVFYAGYILRKPVVAFKLTQETYHPFFEACVTEWRSNAIKCCETIEEHYL